MTWCFASGLTRRLKLIRVARKRRVMALPLGLWIGVEDPLREEILRRDSRDLRLDSLIRFFLLIFSIF